MLWAKGCNDKNDRTSKGWPPAGIHNVRACIYMYIHNIIRRRVIPLCTITIRQCNMVYTMYIGVPVYVFVCNRRQTTINRQPNNMCRITRSDNSAETAWYYIIVINMRVWLNVSLSIVKRSMIFISTKFTKIKKNR